MHTLFLSLRRPSVLPSALFIALITLLSGCASKNPLIDEPVAPPQPILASQPANPEPSVPAPKHDAEIKPASTAKATPDFKVGGDVKPAATSVSSPVPGTKAPSTVPSDQSKIVLNDMSKPAPTGLKRWLGIFTPYKINIQQGNFISQDMAAKLRPGMTKEQVKFLLGTPLLTDLFHGNRWDYLFRLQKPNGELTTNRVAIFFKDNRVERIEGSELPSEAEYLSHIAGADSMPKAKPAQKTDSSSSQLPKQP